MKDYGFIWPFIGDLDPNELAVIDLRPFRKYPNRVLVQAAAGDEWVDKYQEDFIRLVYGYDLIFFVGATRDVYCSATVNVVGIQGLDSLGESIWSCPSCRNPRH